MPTPSPIKMPSVGPIEGMLTACVASPTVIRPEASAAIAIDQGHQHGQQRAERDEQHHRRGHHPDGRADADRGPKRVLDRLPAQVHLQARGPCRLGEVNHAGDVRGGHAVRLGVEDDGGVGDVAVPADLGGAPGGVGAGHRGHRGGGGDLPEHGRDPGLDRRGARAVAGPPDDRVLVPGVPGERFPHQVQRGRGAGSRQGERVGVCGPRGPAGYPQEHQECQPRDQHPGAAPEAPARHSSHVSFPCSLTHQSLVLRHQCLMNGRHCTVAGQ